MHFSLSLPLPIPILTPPFLHFSENFSLAFFFSFSLSLRSLGTLGCGEGDISYPIPAGSSIGFLFPKLKGGFDRWVFLEII